MSNLVPAGTILKSGRNCDINTDWLVTKNDAGGFEAICVGTNGKSVSDVGTKSRNRLPVNEEDVHERWYIIYPSKLVRLLWIG